MVVTIPTGIPASYSKSFTAMNKVCVDSDGVIYVALHDNPTSKIIVYTIKKPYTTYEKLFEVPQMSGAIELAIVADKGSVYGICSPYEDNLRGFCYANGAVSTFYPNKGGNNYNISLVISGGYLYVASQDRTSSGGSNKVVGSKILINSDGSLGTSKNIVLGSAGTNTALSNLVAFKGGVVLSGCVHYTSNTPQSLMFSNVVGDLSKANADGFVTTAIPDATFVAYPGVILEGTEEKLIMLYRTNRVRTNGSFKILKADNDLLTSFSSVHPHFETGVDTRDDEGVSNYVGITSDLLGNIYVAYNNYLTNQRKTIIKKITPDGEISTVFLEEKNEDPSYYGCFISLVDSSRLIMEEPVYGVSVTDYPKSISVYGAIQLPEISPSPKDLKSISDRENILKYTARHYPDATTIREKVNGVVVGNRSVVNDVEYTVSVSSSQWDAIKYGKYFDSVGGRNVVTLEVLINGVYKGESYSYPFTKVLPPTAKTDDVLIASNDMANTAMPSHKKKLVDAIGNKATVGGTGSLDDITKAIESISVENMSGMNIATGTFKTNSSATASVRGISFKPKGIVYQSPSYVAGGAYFIKDFHGDVVFSRSVDFGMNNSGSMGTNIFTPLGNGFDIKTASTVETYSYVVFG